jgi:hypothetical protein
MSISRLVMVSAAILGVSVSASAQMTIKDESSYKIVDSTTMLTLKPDTVDRTGHRLGKDRMVEIYMGNASDALIERFYAVSIRSWLKRGMSDLLTDIEVVGAYDDGSSFGVLKDGDRCTFMLDKPGERHWKLTVGCDELPKFTAAMRQASGA